MSGSELLDPSMELAIVPPEETARHEQNRVAATACVTRLARDGDDRDLLLDVLGLARDYTESLRLHLTESLDEYDARIGGAS